MVHIIKHYSSVRGTRRLPEVRVLNDLPHSLCPGSVNADDPDSPFFRASNYIGDATAAVAKYHVLNT